MEGYKKPSIFEANLIYLILGFALLVIGYIVQSRDLNSGLLITEYIIILLPNLIILKLRGYSLKKVLRLNPIGLKQIIYIILIIIFSYPIAVFLNAVVLAIISSFSNTLPTSVPIPTSNFEYIIGLFIIALAPGICEEVMFRGTIMSAYNRFGYKKSILISSVLFGLFHFNVMNLVGPTFLGIILGILVYKTNSIYASIIAHTLNNSIALTIGYALTKYSNVIDNIAASNTIVPDTTQMIITLAFFGLLAILSIGIIYFLIKNIPSFDRNLDIDEYTELVLNEDKNPTLIYIPLVIILVAFIFLNIRMLFLV